MDTRNDLKISTCGFVEDDCAEGVELMVPPESGGSRSSGLGVGAAFRIGALSGAGVLRARSDVIVESDQVLLSRDQLCVLSCSGCALREL